MRHPLLFSAAAMFLLCAPGISVAQSGPDLPELKLVAQLPAELPQLVMGLAYDGKKFWATIYLGRGRYATLDPATLNWETNKENEHYKQETVRTIEKIPRTNEPVEIEAKVGNKSVRLGQGFMANNDWLSDLSFKVKNISAKPIVRVELELQFPEVQFNNAPFVLPIPYGQIPGLTDSGPKEQSPVKPNETMEMAVGSGIKRIRTDNGPSFGVTKVRLQISMIIFADGTAWRNGFNLIRDPNNPKRYIVISKPRR